MGKAWRAAVRGGHKESDTTAAEQQQQCPPTHTHKGTCDKTTRDILLVRPQGCMWAC